MKIVLIGTGFVGVVSAAVYASFGHEVVGLDIDERKVASLKKSTVPFFEPNLESLLKEQQSSGNLTFTTDYEDAITGADVVMIAVGTPSAEDGTADLRYVLAAARSAAPFLKDSSILAVKSTVPPGTLQEVKAEVDAVRSEHGASGSYFLASLPEFLREGSAVHDTLHPDRVVIGADDQFVFKTLTDLHKPLQAPIVKVSPESAQMAKYAANAYLATRITFINQIADLCKKNRADVDEVVQAIGLDARIGDHYWYPGFGYGGSCFPKDVKELAAYSRSIGEGDNLFNKVNDLNEERIERVMDQFSKTVGGWAGKKVAVLGLSFKPNTDDMREAPSLKVIPYLIQNGASVTGYDPKALDVVPQFLTEEILGDPSKLALSTTIEEACAQADVILALIEWSQIVSFEYGKVRDTSKDQWFIDARNQFDKATLQKLGYSYTGIGKS